MRVVVEWWGVRMKKVVSGQGIVSWGAIVSLRECL